MSYLVGFVVILLPCFVSSSSEPSSGSCLQTEKPSGEDMHALIQGRVSFTADVDEADNTMDSPSRREVKSQEQDVVAEERLQATKVTKPEKIVQERASSSMLSGRVSFSTGVDEEDLHATRDAKLQTIDAGKESLSYLSGRVSFGTSNDEANNIIDTSSRREAKAEEQDVIAKEDLRAAKLPTIEPGKESLSYLSGRVGFTADIDEANNTTDTSSRREVRSQEQDAIVEEDLPATRDAELPKKLPEKASLSYWSVSKLDAPGLIKPMWSSLKTSVPYLNMVDLDAAGWDRSAWSNVGRNAAAPNATLLDVDLSNLPPLAAFATAVVTTLSFGGYDVIWLLPFFLAEDKAIKTVAYIGYMQVVVILSWMIQGAMKMAGVQQPDPIRKYIEVVSSILLTVFSSYLFYEWWNDASSDNVRNESDCVESEDSANEGESPTREGAIRLCVGMQEAKNLYKMRNQKHERLGLWMLFVVSMVGSLDNLAVYSYFLFSDMMTGWQLSFGVLLASVIVAAVAHGALVFKPILKLVQKLPIWVILAVLCMWSYAELMKP